MNQGIFFFFYIVLKLQFPLSPNRANQADRFCLLWVDEHFACIDFIFTSLKILKGLRSVGSSLIG